MTSGIVSLNSAAYLLKNDDDGNDAASGVTGSEIEQDLTPSTHDQVLGIPGDTTIATSSAIVYGDATGSYGLLDRLTAPGDQSRPFLSEADNTRPRQITAWVGSPTPLNISTRNLAATADTYITLFDAGGGFGFITKSASATYDFWQWDTAAAAYKFLRAGYTQPANTQLAGYVSRTTYGTFRVVPQIVNDYAGGLWYAANGGLVNASVAAAAPVGDANAATTLVYLDMLWSFGLTASGITITPYRFASGSTPATAGAKVQKTDMTPGSGTYGTSIDTTVTIPGEYAICGVVASESNVFLVTDRSMYRIGWNDGPNTFEFTRLPVEVPAFSSNPCAWNGEIWVGAGNEIVHIVPGQRTDDTILPDDLGNTPSPFSGRVIFLHATYGYLAAQLIDDLTATPTNAAIIIRNRDGAWYIFAYRPADNWASQLPMLKKLDANGFALGTFASASTTQMYPLLGAGKNPRNLPAAFKGQRGTQRIIWPWEYGQDEGSLKQLLRCRLQVLSTGVQTAVTHIRAYFEIDFGDTSTDVTGFSGGSSLVPIWGGIASGTGNWRFAAEAFDGVYGDYGSTIPTGGSGEVWTEFDGTAARGGTVTVNAGAITAIANPPGTNGFGYTSAPTVYIFPAPGYAGAGATATATLTGDHVTSFAVTAGGAGYTSGKVFVACIGGKLAGNLTSGSGFAGTDLYPKFHRIRKMIEIQGDTTGTLVPTFMALLFEFWEYPKVDYQYTINLRMRVNDTQILNGTKADGTQKSKYDTPAAIVADLDVLKALKNNRTIVPYTGLDGHTFNVLVTKFSRNILSVDSTGIQEVDVQLVLQVAPLQGTV